MRHRAAALLSGVLAIAAATLALPSPAQAAVEGFKVTITQLPDEFEAGAKARTVRWSPPPTTTGRCRKVRWSMVLKVDGVDLDQVKVNRVEDDGDFPLQVQSDGDTARLTDVRFDPGSLCRGQTVTAVYRVAFDDDADGEVTFQAQAFDAADPAAGGGLGDQPGGRRARRAEPVAVALAVRIRVARAGGVGGRRRRRGVASGRRRRPRPAATAWRRTRRRPRAASRACSVPA